MKGSRTCKAAWVRDVVQCQECWKPRAVFAATALPAVSKDMDKPADYATTQLQIACTDDPQFVCGAQLFPPMHPLASKAVSFLRFSGKWSAPALWHPTSFFLPERSCAPLAPQCVFIRSAAQNMDIDVFFLCKSKRTGQIMMIASLQDNFNMQPSPSSC
jgi:hypothetical protein